MSRYLRATYGLLAFWVCFGIPGHIVLEHACCGHDHEAAALARAEACCEGEVRACGEARCCADTDPRPAHSETPHFHDMDSYRSASARDVEFAFFAADALPGLTADCVESTAAPIAIDEPIPIPPPFNASAALRGPPSA